ncbi:MAG: 6-phosphofructokinase [Candidatus Thorarchaeota archaeon]|nr:6-phosphofructokinase [Candidatus Thorarchaeota archaeon]
MKVGVLTSGGDGPGMNAAIRAITRVGIHRNCEIYGIFGGFQGIFEQQIHELNSRSVSRILHRGGTFLTTGRSEEFKTEEGQKKAARIMTERGLDALIAIGGDGTMRGLAALSKHWNGWLIGLPGTIDNDLYGTDYTIGFDTAVNNALEALDKIRDTAEAFQRVFLVEVMGRHAGFIAFHVGFATGASAILMPETSTTIEALADKVIKAKQKAKSSVLVVVAEGDELGNADTIGKALSSRIGEKCRVSVLGYIQRGGNPTHFDRILATRLGAFAIECLLEGRYGGMVGEIDGNLVMTPFEDTWTKKKPLDEWMMGLLDELSG